MYRIEDADFGYKLTFGGFIREAEMEQWLDESKTMLANAPDEFCVFVDMRSLMPLPHESELFMREGQRFYKEKGMLRSVVILDNTVTAMQFKRIAQEESGIYAGERYIDASQTPDWEKVGVVWLMDQVDPDKNSF